MGEIAEMMLDGTLCEGCGEYIGSDAGYPQYCSPECAGDRSDPLPPPARGKRRRNTGAFECKCGRKLGTAEALYQHQQAKGHA